MTNIEKLAQEFSKGNLATEAAFLAGAKQARLEDIQIAKSIISNKQQKHVVDYYQGWNEALDELEYRIEKQL
jgi:hypothetical protein